jgi:beta-phosphoglucomutase-like phosphatase (HAD superfamily)
MELSAAFGHPLTVEELEPWVRRELDEVTAHLAAVLRPDVSVRESVHLLSQRFDLAAVTSSATKRLNACLDACGLAAFFPADLRFSAEDSLPAPRSKPLPDIYRHALARTTTAPERALAIEDSVTGVRSATAAGVETIGNVAFVPRAERPARSRALRTAGASAVLASWEEIVGFIVDRCGGRGCQHPAAAAANA